MQDGVNEWLRAVLDECANAHVRVDMKDPRGTLARLIDWHVEVSLDPRVSDRARALIGQPHGDIDSDTERTAEAVASLPADYRKVGYVMRSDTGFALVAGRATIWLTPRQMELLGRGNVKWGRK